MLCSKLSLEFKLFSVNHARPRCASGSFAKLAAFFKMSRAFFKSMGSGPRCMACAYFMSTHEEEEEEEEEERERERERESYFELRQHTPEQA